MPVTSARPARLHFGWRVCVGMVAGILLQGEAHRGFAEQSIQFTTTNDPRRPMVAVELPGDVAATLGERPTEAAAQPLLKLMLVDETDRPGSPLFGRYQRSGSQLTFTPEFRLLAGATYRALLTLPGQEPQQRDYRVPAAVQTEPAVLQQVYPTADKLPANLLKFYLYFSQPMRDTPDIFDHFHILDAKGKRVHAPWRRQSLWSDDGRRLTLLIHPGRIKRGVNLREELGPVLRPGETYTLVIETGVVDAEGRTLQKPYRKSFTATTEVNTRVSVDDWQLSPVKRGSDQPLVVTFPRPLDHALVRRLLRVVDAQGKPVPGQIELSQQEQVWTFRPQRPWADEAYTLQADEVLEDLAGNTPVRPFDADLTQIDTTPPRLVHTFRPE